MHRFPFVALGMLLLIAPAGGQTITTLAGGGPNHMPATYANLNSPTDVAIGPAGDLYIAVSEANQVLRVDLSGELTVYAGNRHQGFSGDGLLATRASLAEPMGVTLDSVGNLYIVDAGNQRVRRVAAVTRTITTVAGNGVAGFNGDGGPATSTTLNFPRGVAVDSAGNLFITDSLNDRVRRVDAATSVVTTVAGNGVAGYSGDGGSATSASLNNPRGVAVDSAGNLYIADGGNARVRKVAAATGIITTIAGNGVIGFTGDGGLATSAGLSPAGLALDSAGSLLIADGGNHRIRKVDASGTITTVAGDGTLGFTGDGGPAFSARLNFPLGVAVDSANNLFIADLSNLRVRKVDSAGMITTVAGNGFLSFSGDGGPPADASLASPLSVAADIAGNVFIADTQNSRIRKVAAATATISTVAGSSTIGFGGDFGPATSASLNNPQGVAVDTAGNLYIAGADPRIRKVAAATGIIATVAGNGSICSPLTAPCGDGGLAMTASLSPASDVAVDGAGNLFIAAARVRRVDAVSGIITTVAGNGLACSPTTALCGDGGPATSANLAPGKVAVDSAGNLFIADTSSHRIRRVDAGSSIITTVAGSGVSLGPLGDGGPAASASLSFPTGITVDPSGNLFIADLVHQRIRKVDTSGIITTVAGLGPFGFGGDGGPPVIAFLAAPSDVALDGAGNLFIADRLNHRIRRVDGVGASSDNTPPVITPTVTGTLGNNTWYVSNVSVSWTLHDLESAISSSSGCDPATVTADSAGATFTCSATSVGGTATEEVTIKRDATAPDILITAPAGGGTYLLGAAVPADYSCTDNLSGVASCTGPIAGGVNLDTATEGAKSFAVNATDAGGNPASAVHHYSVVYDFEGFLQPIDNLPVMNMVKAGRTIPVKWQLKDAAGGYVRDLASFQSLTSSPITCEASAPSDTIEEVVAAGSTVLRYDLANEQFVHNWSTSSAWRGCRLLILTTADGVQHVAKFKF